MNRMETALFHSICSQIRVYRTLKTLYIPSRLCSPKKHTKAYRPRRGKRTALSLVVPGLIKLWSENGGQLRNASYLSGDGRLYFDDPSTDPVAERHLPALSLVELCQLHFGRTPHKQGDEHREAERRDLAQRIQRIVVEHGFEAYRKQLPPLYGENGRINIEGCDLRCPVKADWNAAKDDGFKPDGAFSKMDLSGLFQTLEVPATNIDGFTRWFEGEGYESKSARKKAEAHLDHAKWLWSGWLEVWLAGQLAEAQTENGEPLFDEVHQSVEVGTKPDDFEMDVVAVRGYRVFLFSCTVDQKTHLVKSKLFEAANRTDRIGGEHARAAMVCLHGHPREVLQTVQEEHWPGYDTLRLFGKPHVVGGTASCKVATGGETPRDVTLLEGIRQWVAT